VSKDTRQVDQRTRKAARRRGAVITRKLSPLEAEIMRKLSPLAFGGPLDAGEREQALAILGERAAILEQLIAGVPGRSAMIRRGKAGINWLLCLIESYEMMGGLYIQANDDERALAAYLKAVPVAERLAADFSGRQAGSWGYSKLEIAQYIIRQLKASIDIAAELKVLLEGRQLTNENNSELMYPASIMDKAVTACMPAADYFGLSVALVTETLEGLRAKATRETTDRAPAKLRAASMRARREARAGAGDNVWQSPSVRLPSPLKWPIEQFDGSPEYHKKGGIVRHLERVWKPLIVAGAIDMALLRQFYPSTARAIDSFKYNKGGEPRSLDDLDIPLLKPGSGRHRRSVTLVPA
jgi:hypothetical protein